MGSKLTLKIKNEIDPDLLECETTQLADHLDSPTLFELSNGQKNPLFISTLLHGNETSGWNALRRLLRSGVECPLVVFLGNIAAAKYGNRSMANGKDFNRIWANDGSPEAEIANQVVDYIAAREPWFALDIHNNSGPNPHYSVITNLESTTLDAASGFSDRAIYATQPHGVISRRTQSICPSLAIEVGISSDPKSIERAFGYLRLLTKDSRIPERASAPLKLYRSRYRVEIKHSNPDNLDGFPHLSESLDRSNFQTVHLGNTFATVADKSWTFQVRDDSAANRTPEFLVQVDSKIKLKRDVIISMYTRNARIALEDCVCYFLEELGPANV